MVVAALAVSACSGSDESDGAGASDTTATTEDGSVFSPTNPDGTAEPVPGTAVELDDDVLIETDDGQIPTPTTNPPVDPDGPDAPPTTVAAAPAETAPATTVPLPAPDAVERIVSMSATHTETLFALGLGDSVIAVDSESDFPAEVAAVRRDDLFADSADLSTLLALEPDVVIVGDDPTGLVGRLGEAGVPSFSGPPAMSLDEVYAQIRGIAALVGRSDLADGLIASMEAEIEAIVGSLPPGERTYFHEIDPSLVTVSPGSFLDSLYGELGLTSIVDVVDPSGFTQLTSDQVVVADPDVIVLADAECCDVTIERLAARAGWSGISAVSDGAVVELSEDLASRWGPRVVELLRLVAAGVTVAAG